MKNQHKYVCIHGHFYQPPRENAWLEAIEKQETALPFHDWNERINFECYAPNRAARILNEKGFITDIVNNYENISFNFGATLLSWLEIADPETYQAILEADKKSQLKYGGHGNAIAQVYNHIIMPLATLEDKITQIVWGIEDFKHRFQRMPEGMWLAETAVDTASLELLAEYGIRYTILAPRQFKASRKLGQEQWQTSFDSKIPYLFKLPSGKSIYLFFYNDDIAQGVAFKGWLNSGKMFAHEICRHFTKDSSLQLVHAATDGESYGHHHRYGEMALADCLEVIQKGEIATLTNYGQFLDFYTVDQEAAIHENSSWSCVHGIERWRNDCGCCTGGNSGWNQQWRKPLRDTLNWLRNELVVTFEEEGKKYFFNPYHARNGYIQLILNRNKNNVEAFFDEYATPSLSESEQTSALRLLEMQRQALLMFTSCGWFFDEVSGIETNQILQYALRAIQFALQESGSDLHPEFVERLSHIPSNKFVHEGVNYQKNILPTSIDLVRIGIHLSVASVFERFPRTLTYFNYIAESECFDRKSAGNQQLVSGRFSVTSKLTYSKRQFSFAIFYLGKHQLIGCLSLDMTLQVYDEIKNELTHHFEKNDIGKTIFLMQHYFRNQHFTLWDLLTDEKQKILHKIVLQSLEEVAGSQKNFINNNYALLSSMKEVGIEIPNAFLDSLEFNLNTDFKNFLHNQTETTYTLEQTVNEILKWELNLTHLAELELLAGNRIYNDICKIAEQQDSLESLKNLNQVLHQFKRLKFQPDIWKSQNQYFIIQQALKKGNWWLVSEEWQKEFEQLGDFLKVGK